jgi:cation-transporting ATPase E
LTIGLPAFFLALEKNNKRVQTGFLRRVILTAIPGGLCIAVMVLLVELLQWKMAIPTDQTRLIAVMVTGMVGFMILLQVCRPLNLKRGLLIITMTVLFIAESVLFAGLLAFPGPQVQSLAIIALLSVLAYPLLLLLRGFVALIAKVKN